MDASGLDPARVRAATQLLRKDYAIGLLFLSAVVLLWTVSNFVTQASLAPLRDVPLSWNLFRTSLEMDMKSLLCKRSHLLCKRTCLLGSLIRVTYLNTSAFTLYLIPFCLRRLWKAKTEPFEEFSRYFVTSRLTFIGSLQCSCQVSGGTPTFGSFGSDWRSRHWSASKVV